MPCPAAASGGQRKKTPAKYLHKMKYPLVVSFWIPYFQVDEALADSWCCVLCKCLWSSHKAK